MQPKFEHTENNHFKWGWGNTWWGRPQPEEQYRIHLGHTRRPVKSFREECIIAAKSLADRATKPIIVGLSGGSDSQMTCLALREAGVPFKALIGRWKYHASSEPTNSHDIITAYEFCKKYNIEYLDFDVNVDEFFRTTAVNRAKMYGMCNARTIVQTATMDIVGDNYCYIMAGGDVMIYPWTEDKARRHDLPMLTDRLTEAVWTQKPVPVLQHMLEHGYEGTSKFFLYTPELIASYLCDPVTQKFIELQKSILVSFCQVTPMEHWWTCWQNLFKPMMTHTHWPEMIPAPKYTGFEGMHRSYGYPGRIRVYQELLNSATIGQSDTEIMVTIPELIKYVTTEHRENDCLVGRPPWKLNKQPVTVETVQSTEPVINDEDTDPEDEGIDETQ